MRSAILYCLIALTCVLFVGCNHRARIGTDYEFVTQQSFMIDSGHYSAVSLYYKGKKVCECVLMGSDRTYRDGILVFMSKAPDKDGGLDTSPQLFAIRGAGPPIILSERILSQPLVSYELEDVDAPTTNEVRAIFKLNLGGIMVTNDILWPEINGYVQEAETSAPIQVAPLGSYRILPMKRPDR